MKLSILTPLCLGLLLTWHVRTAAQPQADKPASPLADKNFKLLSERELAARIDALIEARWKEAGIKPAPLTDDATFIRRLYLDLYGKMPRIDEAKDFIQRPEEDKREMYAALLLENERYSNHFATVWRDVLMGNLGNQQQLQFLSQQFEFFYLRDRLKKNLPYDEMVRELVNSAANFNGPGRPVAIPGGAGVQGGQLFYQANEFKMENLAASVSRLFLGVKLECAQCHDHPFARWTRKEFWEFAAFFTDVQPRRPMPGQVNPIVNAANREVKIPGTDKVVKARFLRGDEPTFRPGVAAQTTLAEWLTSEDNQFFARSAVDHLWHYLMGLSLIEPIEEPSDDVPITFPEVLDELAAQFVAHKYDLKYVIRSITATKAYQRASTGVHDTSAREQANVYARMSLRGLSPEQLFECVAEVTQYKDPTPRNQPQFAFNPNIRTPRNEFISKFAGTDKRSETQTSILQALYMMNNKFMVDMLVLDNNETLRHLADAQIPLERKINEIYLIVLTRYPRAEEMTRLKDYVERGGATGDRRQALSDIFWALINSAEFRLNH